MNENNVETLNSLMKFERKRELIIESIIYGLRNDKPKTEPPAALEEWVGDLAGLVEFDATIQGIIQFHISDEAYLAGEYDRCEALFSKYRLA